MKASALTTSVLLILFSTLAIAQGPCDPMGKFNNTLDHTD